MAKRRLTKGDSMSMTKGRALVRTLAFIGLVAIGLHTPAYAQISTGLVGLLNNQSVPTEDLVRDKEAATATTNTVAKALSIELATLPVSSSSGGFVYVFNRSLAVPERASTSFGPLYTERALRPGRGQSSFGWTYQHAEYAHIDGYSLEDGNFITTAALNRGETAPFSVDTLKLKLTTSQMTLFGNYGFTDRLDVGVAVPIVTLGVDGQRSNTFQGRTVLQSSVVASTTGLADIALRARYRVYGDRRLGLAAGTDVRLPTGRSEDLLGAGTTAVKIFGIGSLEQGRTAEHVNLGFTVGGLSNEFNYSSAVTYAMSPRGTIIGEFFGRHVADLRQIQSEYVPRSDRPEVMTLRWVPGSSGTNMAFAVAGLKWNVAQSFLLNASLLFRVTDGGLTARVVPGIAFDYSFGRY